MTRVTIDQRGAQAGGHVVAGDFICHQPVPELADPKILEEIDLLRKCRWFSEYDRVTNARRLVERIQKGVLVSGTDDVRGRALAWCARILALASSDCLKEAETLNEQAQTLTSSNEVKIAQAFIIWRNGDKSAALSLLASIKEPAARSASLMIVADHEGAENAVHWAQKAGLNPDNFDPEGMCVLINQQLGIGRWRDAEDAARAADHENNYKDCPWLLVSVALAYLLPAVPAEMRDIVRRQLPFQARDFGLAADAAGMKLRGLALARFAEANEQFGKLQLPKAAAIAGQYAMWLSLENPATNEEARMRLRASLREIEESLRWVPFAAQYGEVLDVAAVEREIERQAALNCGSTLEGSLARLSLALMQRSPADVAHYLVAHQDDLRTHVDPKALAFIEIEMLAKSGQRDLALKRLEFARSLGMSPEQDARFQHIVDEVQADDIVAVRRSKFEATDALVDLVSLVDSLVDEQSWRELTNYSLLLFKRNRSLQAATIYIEALIKVGNDAEALAFIHKTPEFFQQSSKIRLMKCWALYRNGHLLEAQQTLAQLTEERGSRSYNDLRRNIAVAIGDWNAISAIVVEEYQNRENRSARELLQAAYIALQIGAPASRELLYYAAEKGQDDPAVLASAYLLATKAECEHDPKVSAWLERAANLSGDDGPIVQTSLKEILEKKPNWDRRDSHTLQLLREGVAPLFLAAESLNRSLIHVLSQPYLVNLSQPEPRKRTPIPAFSAKRSVQNAQISGVVGLEATSLLTLGALDLLDALADSVATLRIPHSTLAWLFEEKQRAGFHQPSRVYEAQRLQNLRARGDIVELAATAIADSKLSAQVGDDLAALIAQADASGETSRQQLVVRPAPVSRVGSLLEEEAELGDYAHILVSCQAIVRKMRADGHITEADEKRALAYLLINEKEWCTPPEISDNAVLYLDALAVSYFQTVRILENLPPAGFRLIVSPFTMREANALVSYQHLSGQISELIEKLRTFLHEGILSGRILVSRTRDAADDGDADEAFLDHPTVGAVAFASKCDAIIVDDRAINQHVSAGDDQERQCQILTTLDVIATLAASNRIATDKVLELRSRLRHGGYLFVDVSEEEVFAELMKSGVKDGRVIETAELKSIRESILLTRMSNYLQVPSELPWLNRMFQSLISVLKRLWTQDEPPEIVQARADWVLELIDLKGWLYCFETLHAIQLLNDGYANHMALLACPPREAQDEAIACYLKWADDRVFSPLQEQFPDILTKVVNIHKNTFENCWKDIGNTHVAGDAEIARNLLVMYGPNRLPGAVRRGMLDDRRFLSKFGLSVDVAISFGGGIAQFTTSKLFAAVRDAEKSCSAIRLQDTAGEEWLLELPEMPAAGPAILSKQDLRVKFEDAAYLIENKTIRMKTFTEHRARFAPPGPLFARWNIILEDRPLLDHEATELHDELRSGPIAFLEKLCEVIEKGETSLDSFIPDKPGYYYQLAGELSVSTSVQEHAAQGLSRRVRELSEWDEYKGLLYCLLLSSHPAFTAAIPVEEVAPHTLSEIMRFLRGSGERLCQLGAVEVGLRALPRHPKLEDDLVSLIEEIRDDDPTNEYSGFRVMSDLFIFADAQIGRRHILGSSAPFYRRLAAFAQSALIFRAIRISGADPRSLCNWARENCTGQFYVQSLADMRLEPRWYPDLSQPAQLKAEICGRLMIAGHNAKEHLSDYLSHLLLYTSSHPNSLQSTLSTVNPVCPGPLEGATSEQRELPAEFKSAIEEQIARSELGVTSFIALVNSVDMFSIPGDIVERVGEVLRTGRYYFHHLKNHHELMVVLLGLGRVAAISRNTSLADEIRVLVRRYRHDTQFTLSVDDAFRIVLFAAGAYADVLEWAGFVGDNLCELAFSELSQEDATSLHNQLQILCGAVPELWTAAGRADAALASFRQTTRHGAEL